MRFRCKKCGIKHYGQPYLVTVNASIFSNKLYKEIKFCKECFREVKVLKVIINSGALEEFV